MASESIRSLFANPTRDTSNVDGVLRRQRSERSDGLQAAGLANVAGHPAEGFEHRRADRARNKIFGTDSFLSQRVVRTAEASPENGDVSTDQRPDRSVTLAMLRDAMRP